MTKTLILAGEISGDYYGSLLAKNLKEKDQNATVLGVGGEALRKNADHFLFETASKNIVGFGAFFQKWSFYKHLKRVLLSTLKDTTIDQVVLIDFHYHHRDLARLFQRFKIPIITYITPNYWIWKDVKRAQEICDYSDKIITIFKPEYDFYRSLCSHVYYFGHPLTAENRYKERELSSNHATLTLFPGSRHQEMDLYLDAMLVSAKQLLEQHPNTQLFLAVSSAAFQDRIQARVRHYKLEQITLVFENHQTLFNRSDCIICASGTTTLEAVLANCPMVVLAALKPITYFFAKHVLRLKLPFITLPNILAEDYIVPELVQSAIKPDVIVNEVTRLLDRHAQEKMIQNYPKVTDMIIYSDQPIEDAVNTLRNIDV